MASRLGAAAAVLLLVATPGCKDPSPVETGPDAAVLFLAQNTSPGAVMEALFQGRVELDQQGCFRLADSGERPTVIWPFQSTLARDDVSLIVLSPDGGTLVRIGDLVRLGGGVVSDLASVNVLPDALLSAALQRCPGSYWIVGEVLPTAGRSNQDSFAPAVDR